MTREITLKIFPLGCTAERAAYSAVDLARRAQEAVTLVYGQAQVIVHPCNCWERVFDKINDQPEAKS